MIKVESLHKDFKRVIKTPGIKGSIKSLVNRKYETIEAVKEISFNVPKGEIVAFIGPNGAGKSTVVKMLTGILAPSSGSININGYNPFKDRKKYVKNIGVVFGQRTQLWWDLPLEETYNVLKEVYEIDNSEYKKRLNFLNEILELDSFIKSPVRTLSLGQRMRADIAASMLHSPDILFLDEPTIGLDVVVKDNIRKAITYINENENTTIVLTTHDVGDIELLCKRVLMIDKGRLLYDGSLDNMKNKYGVIRKINLSFNDINQFNRLKIMNKFNKDNIQIKTTDLSAEIKVNTEKVLLTDVVNYILSNMKINDIAVNDVDTEEIIRRMYKKEVDM